MLSNSVVWALSEPSQSPGMANEWSAFGTEITVARVSAIASGSHTASASPPIAISAAASMSASRTSSLVRTGVSQTPGMPLRRAHGRAKQPRDLATMRGGDPLLCSQRREE